MLRNTIFYDFSGGGGDSLSPPDPPMDTDPIHSTEQTISIQ